MATKRENACWESILALSDKTQKNINYVLRYYGFDRYERKVKFLEDMLEINTEKEGMTMTDRFALICRYIKENNESDFKTILLEMLDEFTDDEKEKVIDIVANFHKKCKLSRQEKVYRQVCDNLNINYNDIHARTLFEAGVGFGKKYN